MKLIHTLTVIGLFAFLSVMTTPTSAISTADLTEFARFAPRDAFIYASVQTNRNFILEVDTLLDRLNTLGFIDEMRMRDLLTLALTDDEILNGDFNELVTPWLGNKMAVIITPIDLVTAEIHTYILFAVRSEANAIDFLDFALEDRINDGFIERVNGEDEVRYVPIVTFGQSTYSVHDNILFIGVSGTLNTLANSDAPNLTEDDNFNTVLGGLSTDNYNGLVYANLDSMSLPIINEVGLATQDDALTETLTTIGDLQFGVGFTLDDEERLMVDVAMIPNNALTALQAILEIQPPVDLTTLTTLFPLNMSIPLIGNGQGDSIDGTFLEADYLNNLLTFHIQLTVNEMDDDE